MELTGCPTEDDLLAFAGGFLSTNSARNVEQHVESCAQCFALTEQARTGTLAEPEPSPAASGRVEIGGRVGRYQILERVGQGAMGTVYAAFDPELDRRVALKLLREPSDALAARLRREAKAMARLSHPNIVAVHDVGDADVGVFLAMAYVSGTTLRAWLASEHTFEAIIDAFVDAGRGLAAAHRAGIVHRDFKPDNVLVDDSGEVRVTDFGLARLEVGERIARLGSDADGADPYLTAPQTLLGTPAYMPPEQRDGADVDGRADQFSYCAALWEAVYGEPAFAFTRDRRVEAIEKGPRVPDKPRHRVPAWLHAVLVRGLAAAPADRFPDMDALLARIERGRGARRRRIIAGLAIGALAGTGIAAWQLAGARTEESCATAAAELDRVWTYDGTKIVAAFSRVPAATAFGPVANTRLEGWRQTWIGEHEAACRATRVAGSQSAAVMDQRMACLRRVASDARAASDRLAQGDPRVLARAAELIDGIVAPTTCSDVDQIARAVPYPSEPKRRAQITELEDTAAAIMADKWTTSLVSLRPRADALVARSQDVGFGPSIARAHAVRGEVCAIGHDWWCSAAAFRDATTAALAASLDQLSASTAGRLARSLSTIDRGAEAAVWLDTAVALARRIPDEPTLVVDLAGARSDVALANRDIPGALAAARESVAAAASDKVPLVVRAATYENLGVVLTEAGEYAAAVKEIEHALQLLRSNGLNGPVDSGMLATLAAVHSRMGDIDRACTLARDAITAYEQWYGKDHPALAEPLNSLASCTLHKGDVEAAFPLYERSAQLVEREREPGPGHAEAVSNMATAYAAVGKFDEAIKSSERAVSMFEAHYGPDHVKLVIALEVLGYALRHANRLDDADRVLQRAVVLADRGHGRGHPETANSRNELALVALARGDKATAQRLLEESVAIADARSDLSPIIASEARLTLAKLLVATDKKRAAAIAAAAKSGFETLGEGYADQIKEAAALAKK